MAQQAESRQKRRVPWGGKGDHGARYPWGLGHWAGCAAALAVLAFAMALPADAQTPPRARPELAAPPPAAPPALAPAPRPARAPIAPAQSAAPQTATPPADGKGPVTGQPLPRFVSLKGSEGNARRGPGLTHRIDWVFTTKGTPLRVTAEYENWRKVEDFEGFGGWVHFALLSGVRYALVTQDMANFHRIPDPISPVVFQAERGVLARILECSAQWCRVNADGQRGWAPKTALWGMGADEILD